MKLKIFPINTNYEQLQFITDSNEVYYFYCLNNNHWKGLVNNQLYRFKRYETGI